ncbi:MAG TPA: hypothetical protein PKX93_03265 [bacterium]|nr:hypothetical protein [bacterium]
MKQPVILIRLAASLVFLSFTRGQCLTAIRKLPPDFKPGQRVTVRLHITPARAPGEITIKEIVPEGWRVIASAPAWKKEEERLIENVYTWRLSLGKPTGYSVTYILEVPRGVKLPKEFHGYISADGAGRTFIEGDQKISIKEEP